VVLPNEEELRRISGHADPAEGARALSRLGPLVAVKRGADGALAAQGGQVVAEAPAEPLRAPIVDTVGAGDSFDAGFLSGWLAKKPIDLCLRRAQACAAATLAAAGGTAGQLRASDPSLQEQFP
jgi:sugar/nucleoside kinase (ribokinase family)